MLPNSPELNPVDYRNNVLRCNARALLLHAVSLLDVADLKRRVTAAWSGLQQHAISEAIDQYVAVDGCAPV